MLWSKWAVPHPQMYTYIIQNLKISRAAKIVRKKKSKVGLFQNLQQNCSNQGRVSGPRVEPAGQTQKCQDQPMSEAKCFRYKDH